MFPSPDHPLRAVRRGRLRLWQRGRTVLLAAALAVAGLPPATAGTVLVVGDVNAARTGNLPLFTALLGGATDVLFSRSGTAIGAVWQAFRTAAGVTAVQDTQTLTETVLEGLDLLVLSAGFDKAMTYTDAEMAAATAFLSGGGRLLLVAEGQNRTAVASYNAVLSRLGTAIRFTGTRIGTSETVAVSPGDPLLAGLTSFGLSKYNTLSGGTALISGSGGPAVAVETLPDVAPVGLPGGLPLAAGALGLLLALWQRRGTGAARA
ncbi:MAG: hypothetical protein JNK88_07825 [Mangrovicoccus sp.]|nr:hypothetical protein [Mangrovicoccus sp.]